ncbi:PDZ domain-containing protein [Patescibacteria group bacterium]|nr:MAG: PDZ domain-containing protein [Patescibacteria group bacterium]
MADATKDIKITPEGKSGGATGSAPHPQGSRSPGLRLTALGFFCFVFGFLGAWVALASGVVEQQTTITEKRNIVSQEGDVVAEVAKQVSPSVVSIVTESSASLGYRSYTQEGAGTGIVISKDGYVITNRHVVNGASTVEVVLADGTTYEDVELIGTDTVNDLAFLKIKGVDSLVPAVIGDSSSVEVGQKVIAIGNALGQYQTSVTSGIVSGLGRPIIAGGEGGQDTESLSNLLQTDAAINPGNSGGPLVNLRGEVIGINTAIDQDAQGIGFAIPINDAKGLIRSVKKSGELKRAFLGVSHVMLTPEIAKYHKLSISQGAYIVSDSGPAVSSDSPAEQAGLRSGDVITKVNGEKINSTNPLLSAMSQLKPGDTASVTYVRDSKEKTVDVVLANYPAS